MGHKSLAQYLFIDQALISGLSNALINGLIAVAIQRSAKSIDVFGDDGVFDGLVIMAFLLPFILTIINSTIVERAIKTKKIFFQVDRVSRFLMWGSQRPYWFIGLCCGGFMSAATFTIIFLLKPTDSLVPLSVTEYGLLVAVIAGLMAAIISPMTAFLVMAKHSPTN
jgi:Flp pilus assembly pilin Flp